MFIIIHCFILSSSLLQYHYHYYYCCCYYYYHYYYYYYYYYTLLYMIIITIITIIIITIIIIIISHYCSSYYYYHHLEAQHLCEGTWKHRRHTCVAVWLDLKISATLRPPAQSQSILILCILQTLPPAIDNQYSSLSKFLPTLWPVSVPFQASQCCFTRSSTGQWSGPPMHKSSCACFLWDA